MSAPVLRPATPEPPEASAIANALLHNIYRAFDYREEQAAYDRLAVSVTSAPLAMIYLEHRQSLEIEKAGGARARVEAVEVTAARELEPGAGDGFTAEFTWTVAGSVTHLGHRHVRQNRYRAQLAIVPEQGHWKIADLTLLDEERLR